MTSTEIRFIGLLANVDSTIKNFDFGNGFKVESLNQQEGVQFFSRLENVPTGDIARKFFINFPCLNEDEDCYYFLSKRFIGEGAQPVWEAGSAASREYAFYLEPRIKLLRLFAEGNISLPLQYYVSDYMGQPKAGMSGFTILPVLRQPFTLKGVNLDELNKFVQGTSLPFKEAYVQLAFENFELSYQSYSPALSFLSLMMGLETLLNPAESEVRHRVSRNVAVLLGRTTSETKGILTEVLSLYRLRSKLIHAGDVRAVSPENLLRLRHFVRESIKAVHTLGLSKEELMELLDAKGF